MSLDWLEAAADWSETGRGVALAVLVDVIGSSPRAVGAVMAVRDDGLMIGSISGGCVEGEVVRACLEALESGESQILEFGPSGLNDPWLVGLTCGGSVRVVVSRWPWNESPSALLSRVREAHFQRKSVSLHVPLASRRHSDPQYSPAHDFDTNPDRPRPLPNPPPNRGRGSGSAPEDNRPLGECRQDASGTGFLLKLVPPTRLLIIGAVHIASCLVSLGAAMGYETVVIDPRCSFAVLERFPVAPTSLIPDWPQMVLPQMTLDQRTACIALTHDPKIDDPALIQFLRSEAGYVGALGGRKSRAEREERLLRAGLTATEIARLRQPIGLDIGASGPEQIAASILAEIVQAL